MSDDRAAGIQRLINLFPAQREAGKPDLYFAQLPGLVEFFAEAPPENIIGGIVGAEGSGIGTGTGDLDGADGNDVLPEGVMAGDIINIYLLHTASVVTVTLAGFTQAGTHIDSSSSSRFRWFVRTADGTSDDDNRAFVFSDPVRGSAYVAVVMRNVGSVMDALSPPVSLEWTHTSYNPPSVTFGGGTNCIDVAVGIVFAVENGFRLDEAPSGYTVLGNISKVFDVSGLDDFIQLYVAYAYSTSTSADPGIIGDNGITQSSGGSGSVTMRTTYTPVLAP